MENSKRILVVGGVAGGASCAARARRLSETAEIIIFERGPYVSFANCGLPYYVGNVIQKEESLFVATAELFRDRFNIDVRTEQEVTAIDRDRQEIEVKRSNGETYRERYDALVLSLGAAPIRPPLPGINLPGVFTVRTVPDSRHIREWIAERNAKSAVLVGAGFVGLEMAENLAARGIAVTMVEMMNQVLPPLDPEMAEPLHKRLLEKEVTVRLSDAVSAFEQEVGGGLMVSTQSGARLRADIVILSIGVRPEATLARAAGLELGSRGGIRVDDAMRTSDPHIWAVGDAVETRHTVTGQYGVVPLAGPANRQGRIAADSICGRDSRFRGVQATAVCGAFGLTAAMTGANEKAIQAAGITGYEKIYLHPVQHASYYPGAKPLHMKLLFSRADGKILGAQAVGEEGAERRIDVIAMAMQMGATVYDLEEAELCYAPQYGTAKDAVNFAGMIAANVLRNDVQQVSWGQVAASGALLVDVREPKEFEAGHVAGALSVPLSKLRSRLHELPRDREIWLYCGVGLRSYNACRVLLQNGFLVRNISGGFTSYKQFVGMSEAKTTAAAK